MIFKEQQIAIDGYPITVIVRADQNSPVNNTDLSNHLQSSVTTPQNQTLPRSGTNEKQTAVATSPKNYPLPQYIRNGKFFIGITGTGRRSYRSGPHGYYLACWDEDNYKASFRGIPAPAELNLKPVEKKKEVAESKQMRLF